MFFTEEEHYEMQSLAKNAVELFIKEEKNFNPAEVSEKLKQNLACFVTIYKNDELRGCIGTIIPKEVLYKGIINNSISAATRDPRFSEISVSELNFLKYEITVLSEPADVDYKNKTELFEKIYEKGVIIKKSFYSAVYLPQVWKHFETKEDFLSSLCQKAGMSSDEWRKLDLCISVFEALK